VNRGSVGEGEGEGDASPTGPFRRLTRGMRILLVAAGVLVVLAGTQLFLFTERTDEYFAWTIANPLTAAFLGAAYWGSMVIELLAARERLWANARIAVPTVLLFTVLTLVVTLLHLDLFHLGPQFRINTRLVTWAWIAIYAIVPVLLVIVSIVQVRTPGSDPQRLAAPPIWLSVLIGVQAVVLVALGVWLLVAPISAANAVWPWALTPLTGRAIGAWLVSIGVAAVHALLERDRRRLRPAAWGYVAIATLEFIALARYADVPDWRSPRILWFVVILLSMLIAGIAAVVGVQPLARFRASLRESPD
jgi:hypothetical protein